MAKIELSNLSFCYDKNSKALDNVSLIVEQGTYVSIVGHNGSGKSTLAKLLLGILAPSDGSIIIDDVVLNNKSANTIRKKMALVFQNPDNQFIGATVEDDIAFGLENRNVPQEDMQAIIDDFATKVGMKEYLKQEPSHLSGGQKQRVAIAGALALNPELLILDEATSMLDPKGKREISELIRKLKENKKDLTILTITHDIEEAYRSDRIIALNKGKVAFDGKPSEMFSHKEIFEQLNLSLPFLLDMEEKLKTIGINAHGEHVKDLAEAIWESK